MQCWTFGRFYTKQHGVNEKDFWVIFFFSHEFASSQFLFGGTCKKTTLPLLGTLTKSISTYCISYQEYLISTKGQVSADT